MLMEEFKKVEVFKDGEWIGIHFKDLKVGDKYRLFEPDGSRVVGTADNAPGFIGSSEWIITKGPYESEEGVLAVECVVGGGVK